MPEHAPTIAGVLVTFNRKDECLAAIRAAADSARHAGVDLHLAVIDNCSTDGTPEAIDDTIGIDQRWIGGAADPAHARFEQAATGRGNTLGLASLSVIRTPDNLGGCGGYNSGLAFVRDVLNARGCELVWMLDDDGQATPGTLANLRQTIATDPAIAAVGIRMVAMDDPSHTLETTVYFNPESGRFDPRPHESDPRRADHERWLEIVGSETGSSSTYTGTRDVDIVAAAGSLVRWRAVERVGFWDPRYFIAGDDAEWCLRARGAGWRIVCCLDAVYRHPPWSTKTTPQREYYRRRNLFWLWRRMYGGDDLRRKWHELCDRAFVDAQREWNAGKPKRARLRLMTVAHALEGHGGRLIEPEPPPSDNEFNELFARVRHEAAIACQTIEPERVDALGPQD